MYCRRYSPSEHGIPATIVLFRVDVHSLRTAGAGLSLERCLEDRGASILEELSKTAMLEEYEQRLQKVANRLDEILTTEKHEVLTGVSWTDDFAADW